MQSDIRKAIVKEKSENERVMDNLYAHITLKSMQSHARNESSN